MFKTLDITKNFLAIEDEYSSFDHSQIVVVPAPYEKTVSYGGGAKHGPAGILEASHYVEFYDEETEKEVYKDFGIATIEPLDFEGKTDVQALEELYNTVKTLISLNKFVVTLGGEHTISQATIAAYAEKYPNLSVLQFDAHSDLRMEYQGNKFSHASVMARVCEFLDPHRVVQVGIRAQCKEEAEFIKEKGITTLYAHEIREGKYTKVLKPWDEYVLEHLTDHVYVTFDVDGFDPSIMPSTGTPEPNGLFWWETMQILKKVGRRKKVVGCDIVELAPVEGVSHPDLLTAKLASKMMNYFVG